MGNYIYSCVVILVICACFVLYFYSFDFYKNDNIIRPANTVNNGFIMPPVINSPHWNCKGFDRLKKVLLAINFHFPHYSSIPILKKYYEPIFGKVLFCGSDEDKAIGLIKIKENKGYQSYECVATAIRMFPQFSGYIQSNDDVIINWWNFLSFDISKIWVSNSVNFKDGYKMGDPIPSGWHWWKDQNAAHLCEVAFNKVSNLSATAEGISMNLSRYLRQYYKNTYNTKICLVNNADFYYIPKQFSQVYVKLSQIFSEEKVFLEVAVPVILAFLLNETNYHDLNGIFYVNQYSYSEKYLSGEAFFETYSFDINISHPFKLGTIRMKVANLNFFKNVVMRNGEYVKQYCLP